MKERKNNVPAGALRIALVYLIVGGLWIAFSDSLAAQLAPNRQAFEVISIVKGWLYVIITALLLFVFVLRETRVLRRSIDRYRLLADNSADVIWVFDLDSDRFEYVSPSVERLRGVSVEQAMKDGLMGSIAPESLPWLDRLGQTRVPAFRAGDPSAVNSTDEVMVRRGDGTTVWCETVSTMLRKQSGGVQVLGVTRDISERKKMEESLRQSEESLRLAYDAGQFGIWRHDLATNAVELDAAGRELFELSDGPLTMDDVRGRIHPEDLLTLREEFASAAATGERLVSEYRVIRSDGEVRWAQVHERIYFDGDGPARRPVFAVGSLKDITRQKQAESAARATEERMRLGIATANIGFYDWDLKTNMTTFSRELKAQLGCGEDEMNGGFIDWESRLHPADAVKAKSRVKAFVEDPSRGYSSQFRLRHKDGSYRNILSQGSLLYDASGKPERVVGTHLDITDQKQIETRLRLSEERLKEAQRVAHVGSWSWNMRTNQVEWSDEMYEIFGIRKENFTGDLADIIKTAIHPDDQVRVNESNARMQDEGQPTPIEYRVVRPDGSISEVWAEAGMLMRDEEDRPSVLTGIVQDITERKQAERALRTALTRLQRFYDADIIGICISRGDLVVDANDYYLHLLEFSREEMEQGKINWRACTPPEFQRFDDRAIMELRERGTCDPYEKQYQLRSGKRVWVLVSDAVVDEESGEAIAFLLDIGERKRAEESLTRLNEELRRSNAELEQFAYVASHDLQEPLRSVTGMVRLLQQRYKGQFDERGEEFLRYAVEGTARMQALINDLLSLSRVSRKSRELSRVESEEALRIAVENLTIAIRESGAVVTHDALPVVRGDLLQLTQVYQNLLGNAIKFSGARQPEIHASAERVDGAWQFSLRDNGIGIEPQFYERIFAVFQRLHTRREYPGNGIGLALCKKIVERHGGRMWVESIPGEGSTFFFTIPDPETVEPELTLAGEG